MDNCPSMLIIHWNARSLYANLSELKIYLNLKKPHLVCISESWLVSGKNPSFVGYILHRKDRINGRGGGMLILARMDVQCMVKQLVPFQNGNLEIQTITIMFSSFLVDVLSVYNPCPGSAFEEELKFSIDQLGSRIVLCGDFNVRHSLWDPNARCPYSAPSCRFHDYLIESRLSLVTPVGLQTRYDVYSNTYSTLDLTLVTSLLLDKVEVSVGRDLGSDHLPVMVNLKIYLETIPISRRPSWKIDDSKWSQWQISLGDISSQSELEDIDEEVARFTALLNKSSLKVFGRTSSSVVQKFSRPWWSPECGKQVALRHKARRFHERNPTQYNKVLNI